MGVGGQPHAPAASTPRKDPVPILQVAESMIINKGKFNLIFSVDISQ